MDGQELNSADKNSTALLTNGAAFDELAAALDAYEEGRSSHWRHEQNAFDFSEGSFSGVGPMGTFSQSQGAIATIAHLIFQIPFRLFGLRYRHFLSIDKAARKTARRQGRQYDLDLLRHTLTLGFLRKHLDLEQERAPVCIIGDGYANMSSVVLGSLPNSRVILVNLAKSLMVDLICLQQAFPGESYALVRTAGELARAIDDPMLRIILVGANDAPILAGADISLAINIESMMEMDSPIIQSYFDLLRSTSRGTLPFYCCNLEHKIFSGEGTSNFYDYPWQNTDTILVHGVCPWTKIRYGNTPPFFARRIPDLHRLVYLSRPEQ